LIIIKITCLIDIKNILLIIKLYLMAYLLALSIFLNWQIIKLCGFILLVLFLLSLIFIALDILILIIINRFLLTRSRRLIALYLLMVMALKYLLIWLIVLILYFRWLEMHLQLWLVIEMRMNVIFRLFDELNASLYKRRCLDLSSARRLQNWRKVKLYLLFLKCTLLLNLVLDCLKVYWSVSLVHLLTFEWLVFLSAK
jgi:hypothetical protein